MTEILRVAAGDLALEVVPEVGGSVKSWRLGDLPLLRETTPEAVAERNVRLVACYPLAPMSNRIAYARFAFGGEEHVLAPNFGDNPHHLHGCGWRSAWRVAERGADRLVLVLDHDPAGEGASAWPYRFRATQTFALEPDALLLSIAVENADARPAPAGIGFHPFFPRRPGATLRFEARDVWIPGPDEIPVRREPARGRFDFAAPRPLDDVVLDNCFAGFGGSAEIAYPQERLRLAIAADPIFGHAVVYVPRGRDYLCVEPVSHVSDAVHRMAEVPDHGLKVLAPHERIEGTMRIAVERAR